MNASNPLRDSSQASPVAKITYPVRITCIVRDYSDANSSPVIQNIKAHANECGALFTTRFYDSQGKTEDRDFIERLPAFHAYVEKGYFRTFYPNTRPIQHVDECIAACIKRAEARQRRKDMWRSLIPRMITWIKNAMRRKTRMEQYEGETARFQKVNNWR